MTQLAHDDRRRCYREQPDQVMEPILNLIHDGSRTLVEDVVDINLRGTRVAFERNRAPRLSPGQDLTASIQAPGLDGCLNISSRVVFNASQGERQLIALVFTELPDITDRTDASFFSVFNRRRNEREAEPPALTAVLLGDAPEDTDCTGIQLNILNHSTKGIAFVVDEQLDSLIRSRENIELAIEAGDGTPARRERARIARRVIRGDEIFYGCMFDEAGSA